MPSLLLSLARGAVTSLFKRAGRPGATLPADRHHRPAAPAAPGPLAAYRRICAFPETGPLPVTYPHVLGFPLAMRLMTGRSFPLPVTGLVHTWIEITAQRALHPTDRIELTVYAEALTPHRRGTEVTVVTEARLADELVWESRSGYLSRHATGTTPAPAAPGPAPSHHPARTTTPAAPAAPGPALPAVTEWRLPADLGRRYGAASGDRNPIHLYPLTARLFGFPRAIAHGMWTVARCLAEAPQPDPAHPVHSVHSVRADFRAPVLLPGTVTYASDGTAFQLRGDGGRVHLTGTTARTAPEAARDGRS
ncbi:MaoC family dehydratase [Streptomyces poriferorum]|uniref:MaoC/PaaZ C-terminal domain-containing protein n=1 Tax=Streptomyces poriferorum TaxID=2798799 RepID=A0ABY9ISH2_9ACTN|nr:MULTISPECIES: MaoC/PaaZ C-terminal domain-containing protein [unclassified Streptomyces]MDP5312718.1 MaoC/PaaZ C-terminal domain-containing protein [Streptomyces sp. Alt4]WLQ58262.1 MaoC/PaaZ C-terminal domain-containing protein [Streptomyces sp. Alt2]